MSAQSDPLRLLGEIIVVPPGKNMPPITGYTSIWEKNKGLLYVPNSETAGLDLSVGAFIEFYLRVEYNTNGSSFNVAYDVSNF